MTKEVDGVSKVMARYPGKFPQNPAPSPRETSRSRAGDQSFGGVATFLVAAFLFVAAFFFGAVFRFAAAFFGVATVALPPSVAAAVSVDVADFAGALRPQRAPRAGAAAISAWH